MPLKGLHLELLRRDSFKFLEYEDKFGTDTLLKLYKVHYSGTKHYRLRSEEWSSELYFHGTAHCGCLNIRAQNLNEYNEPDEWKDYDETEEWSDNGEAEEWKAYYESGEWKDHSDSEEWSDNGEAEEWKAYYESGEWKDHSDSEEWKDYDETEEWKDYSKAEETDAFDGEQQQWSGVVAVSEEDNMSVVGETRMTRIRIKAQDWCSGTFCPTKGILTSGHRQHLIQRGEGHYFSAYYQTAKYFALQKLGQLKTAKPGLQKKNQVMTAEVGLLYSVFICRVRNVCMAGYKYVINDEDILPCYLAIVRHGNGLVAEPNYEWDKTPFV